jgi:hypothetical protein
MDSKQLKDLIRQVEALKTPETSTDFQAGIDAATTVFNTVVQQALDRERMQQLETELNELRARYPVAQPTQKRRGRKPKNVETQALPPEVAAAE